MTTPPWGAPSVVSFAHRETGIFNGVHLTVSDEAAVELNTPPGHIAVPGHHDPLAYRFDHEAGKVVDFQPPAPSADHEWDATSKRWELSQAAQDRQQHQAAARARVAELVANQHGLVRRLVLDSSDAEARTALAALDAEIAELNKAS